MASTSKARRRGVRSFRESPLGLDAERVIELPEGPELSGGWLTQFGTDHFREAPRFEIEYDVSVLLGKLSLRETVYALLGRPPKAHHSHRHFAVPGLIAAQYRCLDSSHPRSPKHASILAECTDQDMQAHRAWWEDPRRARLELLAESGV